MVQNAFAKHPHVTQKALDRRHLIKLEMIFSLTYPQMIAQQFRQLNVHCCHLYFMKTGHELTVAFSYRVSVYITKSLPIMILACQTGTEYCEAIYFGLNAIDPAIPTA